MHPKERFLSAEGMARLKAVLTRDEFYCPQAVAILRLLMLTGCRAGEVVSLQWDWIRGMRIYLPDSNSGPRTVWLSSAPRARSSTPSRVTAPIIRSCFRRARRRGPSTTSRTNWDRIRNEAGLPGLRIHDLRHNWASVAAMNGVDMVTVAKLLGHRKVQTKACPQYLPHYVIEKQDLSVSSPVSTDGASIIRQEPPGSRAPLCG